MFNSSLIALKGEYKDNQAMISFLLTQESINEAYSLRDKIVAGNSVSLPPDEINYPLSMVKESTKFASLIAKTAQGEKKVLYSFSGSLLSNYIVSGYVPPCFSLTLFHETFDSYDREIHALTDKIEKEGRVDLIEERKKLSATAQEKIASIFVFYSWNGKKIMALPDHSPTGTGECAGLKVINYALKKRWEIMGMAEFTFKKEGELTFTPPCSERCGLLLPKMLGLDFVYLDEAIGVINKPSGFLSVPGRGEEKLDSASYRFHTLFPSSPIAPHAHRLDMDTSGVMILAKTKEALNNLSRQFENREIKKTYVALLEGVIKETAGDINLKIRPDYENRPMQIVDPILGKEAHTHWERISIYSIDGKFYTSVRFFPSTGRTHQLRVHAAFGLGHPIKGDNLYGHQNEGERLYLHAESITFHHPTSGKEMRIEIPSPF